MASSSQPVPCSVSVAGSMTSGSASVVDSNLVWRPTADGVTGERVIKLSNVTGHQRNKPGALRASLRLVVGAQKGSSAKPETLVMQFGKESDRDLLSNSVKKAVGGSSDGQANSSKKGPSPAQLAARKTLLSFNPELASAHGRLVKGSKYSSDKNKDTSIAAIDEDEFWSARSHLFDSVVLKHGTNQKLGISNVMDADIKGALSGAGDAQNGRGDVVTATLSNEKMHRIFAERPAVRNAFLENVPSKMTEREFWTRFLRSEYFKAARAGAPPQGEEEANDLALFASRPQTDAQRRNVSKKISAIVNLAADAGDFGVFGNASSTVAQLGATDGEGGRGGHGIYRDGAKEPPPPASDVAVAAAKAQGTRGGAKAAAAKHAAMETLRSLNHHAEVVLRGRPTVPVTDARSAALAAEAQEKQSLDDDLEESKRITPETFILSDLCDAPERAKKTLRIDDPSRYFGKGTSGEGDGDNTPKRAKNTKDTNEKSEFDFKKTVAGVANAMGCSSGLSFESMDTDKPTSSKKSKVKAEPKENLTDPMDIQSDANQLNIDERASRSVLDDLSSSARRIKAKMSNGTLNAHSISVSDLEGLDEVNRQALLTMTPYIQSDASSAKELLKHFWSGAPLITVGKWQKAHRVITALGTLYDQMELRKKSLPPAARHKLSTQLRPLTSAMDGAFSFFDDEKKLRAGAFGKFEAERKNKAGDEGTPIEVS